MPGNKQVCPLCQKSDHTAKISDIYFEALIGRPLDRGDDLLSQENENLGIYQNVSKMRTLARKIAPPAGEKRNIIEVLHPDFFVILAIALVLFFYSVNSPMSSVDGIYLLALSACLSGIYLVFRKNILARFEERKKRRNQKESELKKNY